MQFPERRIVHSQGAGRPPVTGSKIRLGMSGPPASSCIPSSSLASHPGEAAASQNPHRTDSKEKPHSVEDILQPISLASSRPSTQQGSQKSSRIQPPLKHADVVVIPMSAWVSRISSAESQRLSQKPADQASVGELLNRGDEKAVRKSLHHQLAEEVAQFARSMVHEGAATGAAGHTHQPSTIPSLPTRALRQSLEAGSIPALAPSSASSFASGKRLSGTVPRPPPTNTTPHDEPASLPHQHYLSTVLQQASFDQLLLILRATMVQALRVGMHNTLPSVTPASKRHQGSSVDQATTISFTNRTESRKATTNPQKPHDLRGAASDVFDTICGVFAQVTGASTFEGAFGQSQTPPPSSPEDNNQHLAATDDISWDSPPPPQSAATPEKPQRQKATTFRATVGADDNINSDDSVLMRQIAILRRERDEARRRLEELERHSSK